MAGRSWRSIAWDPHDDALKGRLLQLLAAEYGEHEVATAAYYDWLLLRNPCGEAIARVAIGDDGSVAGQYVVVPMQLTIDGTPHDGALSLLTLTNPAYRGQGIFTGLAREVYADCAERGRAFVLGFPNQNSYPGFVRALRFRVLGELPLLLRPLKPSRLVASKVGPRLAAVARMLASPLDLWYAPARQGAATSRASAATSQPAAAPIVEVARFGDAFDAFDTVLARRLRVHQPRRARFLSWRFHECPRDYRVYAWQEGARVRAYVAVRRTVVAGLTSGMLVDFFVDDGDDAPAVGGALVQFALQRLAAMDAHLAGALANRGPTEFAILKAAGFFVCPPRLAPQPFPVIFTTTIDGWERDKPVAALDGWGLEMGDYDAV